MQLIAGLAQDTLLDPIVLTTTGILSVALMSGLVARVVEFLGH